MRKTTLSQIASKYRPDIDGLRAIAVLGVVLYHAGVKFLPGGFVGVDVFFVISGFLITSILLKQMNAGRISLVDFYDRRIRRIMPALFAVLAAVLAVGFFWMMPWDMKVLGASARYTLCSFSNYYFFKTTTDYFNTSVDSLPLLHTWSLGVEEQFYLVYPLILMAGMRLGWGLRRLAWLLGALAVLSLGLCLWRIHAHASECFYLAPWRSWELMVGALLALWMARPAADELAGKWAGAGMRRILNGAGLLGVGLILVPMLFYGKSTLFPGAAALPPCLGAAMVIMAGAHGGWSRRLLSWKPLVFIGLISYSVYLWHWPLLAFQTYLAYYEPRSFSGQSHLLLGLAALPLGYLSWRFVEQPFRVGQLPLKRWHVFAGFAVISAGLMAFAYGAQRTNGFEGRMPAKARAFIEAKNPPEMDAVWRYFWSKSSPDNPYVGGDKTQPPHVALWGDSHAGAIAYEIGEAARVHGQSFRFYGRPAMPPLVGMHFGKLTGGNFAEYREYNEGVMHALESDASISSVVLMGRWSLGVRGYTGLYGPAERELSSQPMVSEVDNRVGGAAEAEGAYAHCVRDTIKRLRAAGKTVFLIYPIPEVGYDVPKVLAWEVIHGRNPQDFQVSAQKVFFERQDFVMKLFDSLPDGPDLVRLKPHELLVEGGNIRLMQDGKALYGDSNHLNPNGTRLLRPLFDQIFEHPKVGGK